MKRIGKRRSAPLLAMALAAGLQSCEPSKEDPEELAGDASPQDVVRYEREYPPIGYSRTNTTGRVATLRSAVSRGDVFLEHAGHRGYLDSLLAALEIDVSSQVLVFSRTSLQVDGIHSETPRAIFFNDDTYVAWVPETRTIEIASMDPILGPVFHTLEQDPEIAPRFERQVGTCLACHDSLSLTGGGVPRFITGSGYTGVSGDLVSHEGRIMTSYRTPLRSRWGGWYVSGRHGDQVHLGNIAVRDVMDLQDLESLRIGNLDDLDSVLDTSPYPSNKSDIVALLILEHQVSMQNAITRCAWDTRMALYEAEQARTDAAEKIETIAEKLVETLFQVGAADITDRITGTSGFAARFESRGPRDADGRSLRELDLTTRLFKYPLSYVIYSAAFDALPEASLTQVYRRIAAILGGEDDSGRFSHLSAGDRTAIHEILRETRPGYATALAK